MKNSLTHAVSMAGIVFLSEALIADAKEEESYQIEALPQTPQKDGRPFESYVFLLRNIGIITDS